MSPLPSKIAPSLSKSLRELANGLRVAVATRSFDAARSTAIRFARAEPALIVAAAAAAVQYVTGILPDVQSYALLFMGAVRFFVYSPAAMDDQKAFDALLDEYVPDGVKDALRELDARPA